MTLTKVRRQECSKLLKETKTNTNTNALNSGPGISPLLGLYPQAQGIIEVSVKDKIK